MLVLEYTIKGKPSQYKAINEAIRTVQFVCNKCLRYSMDSSGDAKIYRFALNKFLRKAESEIKHAQRRIYKKVKGSSGRRKARARYARIHLRVTRQRNEHAKRLARKSCKSNRKLPPQECTQCKRVVKKVLSTRTHVCSCGCVLHRDWNAAINIWLKAKSRDCSSRSNASGVGTSTLLWETLVEQVLTVKLESHALDCRGSVKTPSYNS